MLKKLRSYNHKIIKITIYIQKNYFPPLKQYYFGLLFPEKPKKTRTDQNTLQVFYSALKETIHNPPEVSTAKKRFLHMITRRHSYRYPDVFLNHHVLVFFETNNSKEVLSILFISRTTAHC